MYCFEILIQRRTSVIFILQRLFKFEDKVTHPGKKKFGNL